MEKLEKLKAGKTYRIIHRGNAGGTIFFEKANKVHFHKLVERHLTCICEVINVFLDKNELILDIRFFEDNKIPSKFKNKLHQPLSNLFNSYSKAINKRYERQGSLFCTRFDRKEII